MLDQLNSRTYCPDATVRDIHHLMRGAPEAKTISLDEFRTLMSRCYRLQLEFETARLASTSQASCSEVSS